MLSLPRRTLTLLASLAALLLAPAAAQAGGLSATFATSSDWGSGFVGGYTISNGTSSTINGWKLEFDLPLNETLTGVWNGNMSQVGGHYVITNASWN
jgi:chitinase